MLANRRYLMTLLVATILLAAGVESATRFAVLGDRTGSAVDGIYEQVVSQIERLQPDFVITVGDMVEGPISDSATLIQRWDEYLEIVDKFSMPLYYTPGNNDMDTKLKYDYYRTNVGDPYRSFDYDDLHIIIVDNSMVSSVDKIEAEQLSWLEDDLKTNANAAYTLVFFHKPFWWNTIAEGKPDTLHTLFVKYGVDAVFSGHYHNYFSGEFDGIKYTNLGSSGAQTNPEPTGLYYHFVWVTVNERGIHLAPIMKDAVRPWDEVSVADRKIFRSIQFDGLSFMSPALADDDLTVPTTPISLEIDNTLSSFPINDTLTWDIPEGWTINPTHYPVQLAAGEKTVLDFSISCAGKLYPAPSATVDFYYAEDKSVSASSNLRISREAFCYKADKTPVLDGQLDESCWHDPVTRMFAPDGSEPIADPVEFYFAYDETNLYLAARCSDARIDSLVANMTERDGPVYGEDCVGYFIQPRAASDTVYQLYFNPLGVAFDQILTNLEGASYQSGDRSWNGQFTTKTSRSDNDWSIEIAIPFAQFGKAPASDDEWRLIFRRKQKRMGGTADWQVPIDSNQDKLGILKFK